MSRLASLSLSDDFTVREFRCRGYERGEPCSCYGSVQVDDDLLMILQNYRNAVKQPVTITSAQRCDEWNAHVKGHPKSFHRVGKAADITCEFIRSEATIGDEAERLAEISQAIVPGGCNIIVYRANKFIHIDVGHRVGDLLIRKERRR